MKIIPTNTKLLTGLLLLGFTWEAAGSQPRSLPAPYTTGPGNYVRTWDAVKKESDPLNVNNGVTPDKFRVTTEYSDGTGRLIQQVIKQGALITGGTAMDMVSVHLYDGFGREVVNYLPFASNNSGGNPSVTDGMFKLNPFQQQESFYNNVNGVLKGQGENYFYGATNFDGSPLNIVTKTMAPGNSWVGNNVGVKYEHQANEGNEKVHIWNIGFTKGAVPTTAQTDVYPSGQLFKDITTDENGKNEITYTDKSGNIILKKVQDKDDAAAGLTTEHAGWLCTYYVYDDFGRLRFILPPKAVAYLDTHNWILSTDVIGELCFSNEYDARGRLVAKKSPGAEAVYFVYDTRDRVVYTQDGNQRNETPKKWMVTLFDNLDRPTLTGIISCNDTRIALQSFVNGIINNGSNTAFITPEGNYIIVNANPLPTGNNLYTLTLQYYDNYTYSGAKTFSTNFTVDNTVPADEYEEVDPSLQTIGYVTGTKVRLLDGSNTFLTTTSFYDRKGNTIQIIGDNHKGFTDEITTQYDFSDKVRSTFEKNRYDGAAGITIFTKNTFDILGRVTSITKSINGSQAKTIAEYAYDALGRLSNKKLAPGFAGPDGPYLESLDYAYNIHGWLLGINKDYAASSSSSVHFFGMELGYDKAGALGFSNPQVNGNIAGNAWKTKVDNVFRKYDFSYDNLNRLTNAAFNQQNAPGAGWTKDKMDFTSTYAYDENGNIKTQNQWGVAIGSAPQQIDQLAYNYDMVAGGWTNRLKGIEEQSVAGSNGNLGDFKNGTAGGNVQQYTYDQNGNLLKDLNKEIGNSSTQGIAYNYMNLPTLITFKNTNKTIAYVYDAAGNKLRKILDEPANGGKLARHIETDYLNGFVYQDNELQFFMHEEGRVRKKPDGTFVYDYFIKDHLSNVRMVLTEELQQDPYPIASLESSKIEIEKDFYTIHENDPNIVNRSEATGIPDYANNNGIPNNPPDAGFEAANSQKLYKLNSNSAKTGLGIALKVMAGDEINVFGKSYYFQNTSGTGGNSTLPIIDLLAAFLNTPATVGTAHGLTPAVLNTPSGIIGIQNLISQQNSQSNTSPTKPRAFINVIFFDEQFKSYDYRLSMVGSSSQVKDHFADLQNIAAAKSGYVYIYCSNESPVDVFFDNLQVVHTRSPILEENHYYSYGLKIAAISSKAAGALQNRYLFQGDFSEYDEETGYNEFDLRHYDAQVGRWTTADPYEQFASPYLGMGNSPGGMVDPDGGSIFNIWELGSLNHFADAAVGALIGGVIGGIDNGWEGAKTGMAIGGSIGLGAGFVNWSDVGGAIGNVGSWVGGLSNGGGLDGVVALIGGADFFSKGGISEVTREIEDELNKFYRENKLKVTVKSFSSDPSASTMDDVYDYLKKKSKRARPLFVYGYSLGGLTANQAIKQLNADNISVNLFYAVDAALGILSKGMEISSNVDLLINVYQTDLSTPPAFSRGYPASPIKGNTRTRILNVNYDKLKSRRGFGAHGAMAGDLKESVIRTFQNQMKYFITGN